MPILFNDHKRRLAFQFGRQHGLPSTNELVDQLQSQLAAERNQHAFNLNELERQNALLLREIAELKLQLIYRDRKEALARATIPSASVH
jgi:hypothetical protein